MSLISGKHMSLISGKHMSLISGKHINVQACYITYLLILFVLEGTSGREACYMDYLNCVVPEGTSGRKACYMDYLNCVVPEGTSDRKACYMDYLNCVDIVVCVILLKEVLNVFLSYIALFKPRG
jgi:hypothetical protein